MRLVALVLLWPIGLSATLVLAVAFAANPTATLKDGTKVIGTSFTHFVTRSSTPTGIVYERYQGVPYAAPPTGTLRFSLPQPAVKRAGPVKATKDGPLCLQGSSIIYGMSEDCLYLNINKRSDVTQTNLPVLIFIHGGGLTSGGGNSFAFMQMLDNAINASAPIIVITLQYRLNVFGFTASSEFDQMRSTSDVGLNLGHQDQRMAINWVRNNIAAFGGDNSSITIMGQSAGAFSVSAQLMGHPNNTPAAEDTAFTLNQTIAPFRAAIMMSGAPAGTGIFPVSTKNDQYQRLLDHTKCSGSTPAARLTCLRLASNDTLINFADIEDQQTQNLSAIPLGYFGFSAVQDGGPFVNINGVTGFYGGPASLAVNNNSYAHVPMITGSVEDEGTLFANKKLDDTDLLQKWTLDCFAVDQTNSSYLDAWSAAFGAYPDQPPQGSPFNAPGDKTNRFYYPRDSNQFKRAAAIYGDIRYQAGRRFFVRQASDEKKGNVTIYNYHFKIPPGGKPISSNNSKGVLHGTDLFKLSDGSDVGNMMSEMFARFVNAGDPNFTNGTIVWKPYDANRSGLEFALDSSNDQIIQMGFDNYREDAMKTLFTPDFLNATGR